MIQGDCITDENGIQCKKAEDFSGWYAEVLLKSEFIDYTDVSGSLAFRPSSYYAWQTLSRGIDAEFEKLGIENVYFPLLIPQKFLERESEHFKGFTPEVAWVTQAGETKFDEKLAIRPTSETIMYPSYSKWIRSWRDLPMRYNQWNSVLRWEFKHPTPFIRSREFLWNEGHTVFATKEEAEGEKEAILGIYLRALKHYLALPGIPGKKTDKEKFAGAVASYSIEMIMPDGWALQGPDFHNDGQNFSKAFEIKFLDREGKQEYAWQNTFAISTRVLGVMVATHGDDKGLVIPPRVSRIQAIIVPIFRETNKEKVLGYAKKLAEDLGQCLRVKLDEREGYSPGYKFNEWELRGVPIRIEIGEREIASESIVAVRRDNGAKETVKVSALKERLPSIMEEMHESMYSKALSFMESMISKADTYESLKDILKKKGGIVQAGWCMSMACEDKIKEETGAKITNMPENQQKDCGKCIYCGKGAKTLANFARSY